MQRNLWLVMLIAACTSAQARSIYCAAGAGYIHVGMTQEQVLSACGQPASRAVSNRQPTKKIDVTQLIYTSVAQTNPFPGLQNAFYTQWSLPSGLPASFSYQINIVHNKVVSVVMNGAEGNATSICGGSPIQPGDDISQVLSLCGTPSATSTTYVNQPIPGNNKTETWLYQFEYQAPFSLTFINGSLESID